MVYLLNWLKKWVNNMKKWKREEIDENNIFIVYNSKTKSPYKIIYGDLSELNRWKYLTYNQEQILLDEGELEYSSSDHLITICPFKNKEEILEKSTKIRRNVLYLYISGSLLSNGVSTVQVHLSNRLGNGNHSNLYINLDNFLKMLEEQKFIPIEKMLGIEPKCTCDSFTLFNQGCQCEYQKYRNRLRKKGLLE